MISLYSDSASEEANTMASIPQQRYPLSQPLFEIGSDDADGEKLADRFQMLEELGSGSFGVVYKAIEKATGEIVAIKHVDLESSEEDLSDIISELSVLSSCASSHVTKYRLAFLRRQTLWIVMEYLGGGSCADLLKPPPHSISESHIAIICRELLLGLAYLHSEGKLHRDIKAANVLLGMDGRVKLADFGVAAQLVGLKSVRNTFVGTPFWMAPEVIQQEGHDAKADVWSLGITAMELANGEPPHANVHPMKVLFLIPKQSAPRLEGGTWSKEFRDFVACCLIKDVDQRPSAKELLRHKFVKNAGKIEGLQELIVRKQEFESAKGGERNLKYYAETLRNISQVQEDDDWLFETVKAVPTMDLRGLQTQKRRKVGSVEVRNDSNGSATKMMDDMKLERQCSSEMKSTMRRISHPLEQNSPSDSPSVRRTTKKRVSSGNSRQPLGVNMSFGNSPSTVRQFRRVSPNGDKNSENEDQAANIVKTPSKPIIPSNPFPDSALMPPPSTTRRTSQAKDSRFSSTASTIAAESKEVSLGRRLYEKAIGISCQDVLNETGDEAKREAVARLAEAFSDLESVDPEGMYHIMNSIMTRMKQDPKLQTILPPTPPSSQSSTASNTLESTPSGKSAAAKLILAQNNPHLKSHRRRQSTQVGDRSRDSSGIWSPKSDKKDDSDAAIMKRNLGGGLEHTRQLTDVLFERWCEGLRVRWPAV